MQKVDKAAEHYGSGHSHRGVRSRDHSMKSSTTDKIEGGIKQVKGKVKEAAGKITGDVNLQDRGTADVLAGKVQSKVGDIKKVVEE